MYRGDHDHASCREASAERALDGRSIHAIGSRHGYPEGAARSVTGGESESTDAVFTAGDAQAACCRHVLSSGSLTQSAT